MSPGIYMAGLGADPPYVAFTMTNIEPHIGYFASNGGYIGLDLLYQKLSRGNEDGSTFGIGPCLGIYFGLNSPKDGISGSVYPYIKLFLHRQTLSSGSYDINGWGLGAKSGFNIMLSDFVALDTEIQVSSDALKSEYGGDTMKGLTVRYGVGISAFIY